MRLQDLFLLTGMRRGGGKHWSSGEHLSELSAFGLINRQRRDIEFQIADSCDPPSPELAVAFCVLGRAHQAQVEVRQQGTDQARHQFLPARIGALGQSAVDQHKWDLTLSARSDQVGPQVGFDEQRELRLPVTEKPRNEIGRVERDELMDDASREPLARDCRRCNRAGCDEQRQTVFVDVFDQRQRREQFADACAVHPDEPAAGAGDLALAAPLGQAYRVFLAALEPVLQQLVGEWCRCPGREPIERKRSGRAVAHAGVPSASA